MLEWPKLIEEHDVWTAHNFPGSHSIEGAWGVMEEVGELAHAHLKERQNIRGSADEHQAAAKDALGDMTVYLLGVMVDAEHAPDPTELVGHLVHSDDDCLLGLGKAAGHIAEGFMGTWNHSQMIVGINAAVAYANRYCQYRGWDYEAIVTETWDAVKQRDWIKYPDTGLPPAEDRAFINTGNPED